MIWSVSDLIKALRYLTDSFSSVLGSSSTGIKVPTVKQRKGFYENFKECTFKPTINKKSEFLEKQHWANFFHHQHQKATSIANQITSESK